MKMSQLIKMLNDAMHECGDTEVIFQNIENDDMTIPISWIYIEGKFFIEHMYEECDLSLDT